MKNVLPKNSWLIIIALLLIFFPIGNYFLMKKVNEENHDYAKNAKAMKKVGWLLLVFGFFYTTVLVYSQVITKDYIRVILSIGISLLFFYGGGTSLIKKSKIYKENAVKFKRYEEIISNKSECSLDMIAKKYATSYEQACNDLQEMISSGYLPNSYVNKNKRILIINKSL